MILCTRFITLTSATVAGLTSYAGAAIVDIDASSPHSPSDISATSNGKSKRGEFLVLKGTSSATNGVTKFLKSKRKIRGERKTKEHTRKLQAPPQLLDIVVGNAGQANQLLHNNGDNTFTASNLPGGNLGTNSIVVVDVDNDGFDDIIVGNSGDNQLLLNNGNNTFTDSILPGGTSPTTSIVAADVNKDGFHDIIVGNFGDNQLLINNGNNTFTVETLPGGALSTSSIATADVDNDGDIDIIVGNRNQVSQLLLNNGNGTFTVETLGTFNTFSIATADVDDDGDLDIIIYRNNSGGQANQVLINDGNNTFTASDLPGGVFETQSIATADVNDDGFDDIIVGNSGTVTQGFPILEANQLLINNGNGTFTNETLPGGILNTLSIATADVNNDGFEDIIVGNSFFQANQLLINSANGMFTPSDLPGGDLSTCGTSTRSIAVIRRPPPAVSMFYS